MTQISSLSFRVHCPISRKKAAAPRMLVSLLKLHRPRKKSYFELHNNHFLCITHYQSFLKVISTGSYEMKGTKFHGYAFHGYANAFASNKHACNKNLGFFLVSLKIQFLKLQPAILSQMTMKGFFRP